MPQQLIETREAFDLVVTIVASDATTKCAQRQVRHQLREHQLPVCIWTTARSLENPSVPGAAFKSRPPEKQQFIRQISSLRKLTVRTLGQY